MWLYNWLATITVECEQNLFEHYTKYRFYTYSHYVKYRFYVLGTHLRILTKTLLIYIHTTKK